jgi:hypothetical protein
MAKLPQRGQKGIAGRCGMPDNQVLVTVYIPKNEAELLVVGALLQNAGIKYYSKNSTIQNLFGAGQIGSHNLIIGPVEIQISPGAVEQAKEVILKGISDHYGPAGMDDMNEEDKLVENQRIVRQMVHKSVIFSILWLGGIGSVFAIYYGLSALLLIKKKKAEMPLKGKIKAVVGIFLGISGIIAFISILHHLLSG